MQIDYEKLAKDFNFIQDEKEITTENIKEENHSIVSNVGSNQIANNVEFSKVVGGVQDDILKKAKEKITDETIVDKHAENLKNIADKALEVDAEKASLIVEEQEADNKVRKQEIKNRLIVLKAEAIRLEKEQKQLDIEQKAEHKARNKAAKWEMYKDKLEKMHYSYVPNPFILAMLLFFDGVRSFFDGLGTVSTSIVKAFKWILLIGAILIVLFSIPVTRDWITNLLSGGK